MSKSNRIYKLIISSAISVTLIVLILLIVDLKKVILILEHINIKYILIALLFYPIGILFRTFRWKILLSQNKTIKFTSSLVALIYGFMINNLFPVKIGEIARAELISKKINIRRSFAIGTIIAERIIDSILVLILLFISVIFSKTLYSVIQSNWLSLLLVFIFIISLIFFLINRNIQNLFLKIIPEKFKEKAESILLNVYDGIRFYKSKKILLIVICFSLLIWAGLFTRSFILLYALEIKLPLYAYIFIVCAGSLGMVIPSSPGNIGVYHAVSISTLLLFMVNKNDAFIFAIISHALDFFPNVIIGLIIQLNNNLRFFKNPDTKITTN